MARYRFRGILALLLAFLWTSMASSAWAADEVEKPKNIKRVIVVVFSGTSQEGIRMSHTPTLNGLGNEGVRSAGVISVYPVGTGSALTSLSTGAVPVVHGYQGGGGTPKAESLWRVFSGAGLKTAVVSNSEDELKGVYDQFTGQHLVKGSDRETMDQALQVLKDQKPYGMMIILNGPHKAGHSNGSESPNYRKAINDADNQLGRLTSSLRDGGELDETLLVVTGDHGMAGTKHGSGTEALQEKEYVVPLVIRGPKLSLGAIAQVQLVDLAPTIAQLTNMRRPANAAGDVLWNVLGADLFGLNRQQLLEKRVQDLSQRVLDDTRQSYKMSDDRSNIDQRVRLVEEQRGEMTRQVEQRDQAISGLENRIGWWRLALGATVILAIVGFVFEYILLRKRFLMFG